ncbi:hypothetical protein FZC76_12650 [Sutcliffiella horikoshii]|uniref:RNA polymerase sigma-70 region 2 domain-containing protein n=1 Tax=Sutcliffiella horikoshii TaxID=79883 RepID=A0A5D4SVH4_9BACI|nr:hypothetical protein [Sutcliffiella horikoshii]TYS67437.1 hypothetical protein FZC76_12650 [Sutcliffiella horikoshii]
MKINKQQLYDIITAKDQSAFELFYDQYEVFLYQTVRCQVSTTEEAERILEDTLKSLWNDPSLLNTFKESRLSLLLAKIIYSILFNPLEKMS